MLPSFWSPKAWVWIWGVFAAWWTQRSSWQLPAQPQSLAALHPKSTSWTPKAPENPKCPSQATAIRDHMSEPKQLPWGLLWLTLNHETQTETFFSSRDIENWNQGKRKSFFLEQTAWSAGCLCPSPELQQVLRNPLRWRYKGWLVCFSHRKESWISPDAYVSWIQTEKYQKGKERHSQ